MARTRLAAAALLSLVGAVLALILLSKHYGVPLFGEAILAACGAGGGCDIVSQSRYASFLGLPLAAWGVFYYASVFALLTPLVLDPAEGEDAAPSLAFFLAGLAVAIDLALLGLQLFAIKAFCEFCIATYFVNAFTLFALWPFRQPARAVSFLTAANFRRGLAAWMVASLGMAGAAVAADSALQGRKAAAGESILGIPATLKAPEKAAPGSVEEQLAEARAEAKKWKETLDDERKLQIYLNQKARDDFNQAPPQTIDLTHAPEHGAPNGPIKVASYSDFMCPFCRDLASAMRNYLPTAGNQVTAFYKHYPLDNACNPHVGQAVHPGSCELSLAGICAQESGRFWEYHDRVFAERWDKATRADALRIGAAAGLQAQALGACMDAAATRGRLSRDIEEGARVGVESTPTLFVNGRKLSSSGVFLLAVEEERKRLSLPQPSVRPNP